MSVGYRAFIAALVIALFTAVFVLIFTGEPRAIEGETGGNFVRNILFDFQTLITGVLALAAAWWTVTTMQATDERANQRHEESMALAVRGDKLRIERALVPQMAELEWCSKMARRIILQAPHGLGKYYEDVDLLHKKVADILSREQLTKGTELFGGDLAHDVHDLKRQTDKAAASIAFVKRSFENPNPRQHDDDAWEAFILNGGDIDVIKYVNSCASLSVDIVNGMGKVAARYGVNFTHNQIPASAESSA